MGRAQHLHTSPAVARGEGWAPVSVASAEPMRGAATGESFALLDASFEGATHNWSRLLEGIEQDIVCTSADSIAASFDAIEQCLARGWHVLGLFNYEFGHALQPRLNPLLESGQVQFRALAFRRCTTLDSVQVEAWLAHRCATLSQPAGIANLRRGVTEQEYLAAIARIRAYLRDGDCYQVNYTFQLWFDYFGAPLALYRRIRERQPVGYGAFIEHDGQSILSFSPELFLRRSGDTLTAKPMKGTSRRGGDEREDRLLAQALAEDAKSRAENLMIVDLLRNDLGRVARSGSVRVQRLFDVERYRTLLQMTSTISAQIDPAITPRQIFAALFPCGSVTGAPKLRCMQIIDEIETAPRGLYTGALGWFEPDGDFCFNVAIRTLLLDQDRRGSLGIGSGIVFDSSAADEFAECLLKASFVTGLDPGFDLIESLRLDGNGYANLDLHLERLANSARYFGFACDLGAVREALRRHCDGLCTGGARKVRLLLSKDGAIAVDSAAIENTAANATQPVWISEARTDSRDPLLRHKTTARQLYERELATALKAGCFDALFFNERSELTEGARSNVFLQLGGAWFTPPLSSGVGKGTGAVCVRPRAGAGNRADQRGARNRTGGTARDRALRRVKRSAGFQPALPFAAASPRSSARRRLHRLDCRGDLLTEFCERKRMRRGQRVVTGRCTGFTQH